MMTYRHEICLESKEHFNGRMPTHHLGFLFADLPTVTRGAVSMALRNRSNCRGKQPGWIKRASDIRFVGHSGNGQTQLQFECLSLESAASEIYQQSELFETGRPDGRLTGLDLLMIFNVAVHQGNNGL